jgi:hypothetical protein
LGDNASLTADMASVVSKIGARLRSIGRRSASGDGALGQVARAYRRARGRPDSFAAELAALRSEVGAVRERHGEQIERLEELSGDLVRAVETLRASISESGRDR